MNIDLTPEELIAAAFAISSYYDKIKAVYSERGIPEFARDITINHIRIQENTYDKIIHTLRQNGYPMKNRDLNYMDVDLINVV